MLVFIIMQENVFNSMYYKRFVEDKLAKLLSISSIKAHCLAYIYNNRKIKKIIKIQYDKKMCAEKLAMVQTQVNEWNNNQLVEVNASVGKNATTSELTRDQIIKKHQKSRRRRSSDDFAMATNTTLIKSRSRRSIPKNKLSKSRSSIAPDKISNEESRKMSPDVCQTVDPTHPPLTEVSSYPFLSII